MQQGLDHILGAYEVSTLERWHARWAVDHPRPPTLLYLYTLYIACAHRDHIETFRSPAIGNTMQYTWHLRVRVRVLIKSATIVCYYRYRNATVVHLASVRDDSLQCQR